MQFCADAGELCGVVVTRRDSLCRMIEPEAGGGQGSVPALAGLLAVSDVGSCRHSWSDLDKISFIHLYYSSVRHTSQW